MSTYHLSWTDTITGETAWRVERKTMPSGDYGEVGYATPDQTSYNDDTAPDTGTFRYRIRPQFLTSYGAYSNEVTVPAPPALSFPTGARLTGYAAPLAITLQSGVSLATGGIKWTNIADETEFRIKWGTTPGSHPNTETVGADVLSSGITFLGSPGTYYLVVCGANSGGVGPDSNELTLVVI